MMRIAAIVLALIAPFVFPWPLALILGFIAAVFIPFLAPLLGVLVDSVYWTPGTGLPYATMIGLVGFLIASVVHRFMKTRIMGG